MMAEEARSKLPPDPEYWAGLEQRIRADAEQPLARYGATPDAWYGLLARSAPWLVAASAAAMLVLWFTLPPSDAGGDLGWIERFLAPDELAGTLVGGAAPPSVDTLMVQFSPQDNAGPR